MAPYTKPVTREIRSIMKKFITTTAALITAFSLVGVTGASAQAATRSQILQELKAPDTQLYTETYYQTTRAVTISTYGTPIRYKGLPHSKLFHVTLPKGVIIAGRRGTDDIHKRTYQAMAVQVNQVNGRYLAQIHRAGYALNQTGESYQVTGFKRVARPAYLPTDSVGKLYRNPSQKAYLQQDAGGAYLDLMITSDGYVQLYDTHTAWPEIQVNPQESAKIVRTTTMGATRTLMLDRRISALKTPKVRGQYRLTITNEHRPVVLRGDSGNDIPDYFYSQYRLNGIAYFTPIGENGD